MKAKRSLWLCLFLWPLVAAGCGEGTPPDEPDPEGIARREQGWLRGDLHLHTTYSDGDDPPGVLVRIAEYFDRIEFLVSHRQYVGNGLDFISVTDHRNVEAHADPGWKSERLILLNGMEWGSGSHANTIGIHTFIPHDPDADGLSREDVLRAIAETRAQGGIFSLNHPFNPELEFPFDVRGHDAIEVWNSGFGLMSPTYTLADLAEWEAARGSAGVFFRKAVERQDVGGSFQALVFYEALLARGVHVALVGGSDRHTVLPPGFPATWVRSGSADAKGVLDGIRARHTFVARGPAAAQVLLNVRAGSRTYEMGDEIPVPLAGGKVTVTLRVGRADGGRLRLLGGGYLESDQQLAGAELGKVLLERNVVGDDFSAEIEVSVKPGDWFYPQVWEPLYAGNLLPEKQQQVRELALAVARAKPEDFMGLASVLVNYIPDTDVLLDAKRCDPSEWDPEKAQCLAADDHGMATYFLPDFIDRAFNVIAVSGEPGDWCMGAVGSAVRFVSE